MVENNHTKLVRIGQETRNVTLKRTVITGLAAHLYGFNICEWMKQRNFNYRDIRVWNGFSWHNTVASVVSFERANAPSGFVKVGNILTNLVSQFDFCCTGRWLFRCLVR